MYKVRGWLKTRGEDMVVAQCDIGTSVDSVQAVLEHHDKCEAKARVSGWGVPLCGQCATIGRHHDKILVPIIIIGEIPFLPKLNSKLPGFAVFFFLI